MNNEEVAKLVNSIKQTVTAQRFDEFTPSFWAGLLTDVRAVDAYEATKNIILRKPFVDPGEIVREVKRIRRQRIEDGPPFDPRAYPGCDDPAVYGEAIRDHNRRIADGEPAKDAPPVELTTRPVTQVAASLVRRLPGDAR